MSRRELREKLKAITPNLIDRVVNYVDPVRGAERQRARMMLAVSSSYVGASKTRRATSEWRTSAGSADADTLHDLPELRERSRDLVRNAPLAGGAIHTVVTRTVGTGLAMQPAIRRGTLDLTDAEVEAWQEDTRSRFELWAGSKNCDIERELNFYEIQELGFRSALENGDAFCLLPRRPRPYRSSALCLQLIEADRCSNPGHACDTNVIAGGIKKDADGAPQSYFFSRVHPGEITKVSNKWDEVQAFGGKTGRRNVLHLYRKLRIGQRRGVPYLAPVIESLKQLTTYAEAEIMAAVISGMFTVFVKTEDGNGLDNVSGLGAETGATQADADLKLASGSIIDLNPGESIETANPGRPNANFDPFFLAIVRQIGVGLELPFEVLIKHFNSSYSAARAALLDAWLFIRARRDWLRNNLCQPVYEAWLEEEIANGRIDAPGFFDDELIRHAYSGAEWVGDGPGSIDPVKEVIAAEKRIAIGVSTRQKESMLHDGGDWRANNEQLGREKKARGEQGIDDVAEAAPPATSDSPGEEPAPADPGAPAPKTPAPRQESRAVDALIAIASKPAPDAHIHVARPPVPWVFDVDESGRTTATPLHEEVAP